MSEAHLRASPPARRADIAQVAFDGRFEGYASVFGVRDLAGDIVMPGAFRASLATRGAAGIKMLYQHHAAKPIGVWSRLEETPRGLYAVGRILPEIARGRELLALMRAGALDGLSIGFHTLKARREERSGVRRLYEIDLWEISIVTFPMQPAARISAFGPLEARAEDIDALAETVKAATARLARRP